MSRRIRLALDATYAAYPNRTGIGVYSEKLIAALGRSLGSQVFSQYQFVLGFRPGPFLRWAWQRRWPANFAISPLLDPWLPVPRATLFHGLNQRLPERTFPLRVVTLHEHYPALSGSYSTAEFRQHMSRRIGSAIWRADRIIAVSDSVRQHLVRHEPAVEAKVRVIHHGVDDAAPATPQEQQDFRERVLGLDPQERFFLNVGAVQTRKNIAGIATALRRLPGYRLVLAGADGYGAEEIRSFIRKEAIQDRVLFLGHAGPQVLRLLYSSAAALVFPSFEEAFGLPILEAMSYGLPVITSNVSAMPEVAGDAALLVDPNDISQIGEAMRRVVEDEPLARELSGKGKQRAAQFTWDQCAARTWAVYQELLQESR